MIKPPLIDRDGHKAAAIHIIKYLFYDHVHHRIILIIVQIQFPSLYGGIYICHRQIACEIRHAKLDRQI